MRECLRSPPQCNLAAIFLRTCEEWQFIAYCSPHVYAGCCPLSSPIDSVNCTASAAAAVVVVKQVYVYRGHKALELAAIDGKEEVSSELAKQVCAAEPQAHAVLAA